MFVLTAFDRPPREYKWEQVFPALEGNGDSADDTARPVAMAGAAQAVCHAPVAASGSVAAPQFASAGTADGNAGSALSATMAGMAEEMARLRSTTQALNEVSETLLASYKAITDNSANITAASTGYVEQMLVRTQFMRYSCAVCRDSSTQ